MRCTRVVQTLTLRAEIGRIATDLSGFERVWECSGGFGRVFSIFFGHYFIYAFASVCPFSASVPGSGGLATSLTDARLKPVTWRQGVSCVDAHGEVMSGQSGEFSLFWTFAPVFAYVSSLSLLGIGQPTVIQGPSFSFRSSVGGSHGWTMMRSQ